MSTKDIGNLRTRLSWEDEGANRSLEGFRRDLKGLRSEMNLAKSHGKDYTNSLKGMREQSDILSRRLKTQQERVKELKKRYDESVKAKGEDAKQTQDLAAQYNNAAAEMNRTEAQLKRLNDEIKRQESPWTKLGENMTKAGDKLQSFGRGMTDFGKSYTTRVTAPIVAGGVAMFKAASDYESAFAGVRKTVDMSEEGYKRLSDGIRNMAKELPAAATDIAAVAESAGQLGIQNDAILGFTRTIIDLGEATNLTREQAATEFARFANIVGMSQKDFDRLGSSVVSLGNNMATTESEIVSMGMRLAAQGSLVGMTEAQIMALAATMSSLGIEAEAGGTAMTTVLKKIESAVGEGGKSLDGFAKAAGVSSKEFSDAWKNDPITALDMFIKGLSESGAEGENLSAILADLGIKGIREADTILRMAGASDLLADAVSNSTNAWKENTALSNEAAQRYKTTESQLKILWNRVKDVAITLGDALIPATMDAIDAAEPLIRQIESGAKAFSEMDESQQRTIIQMLALVAAVGPAAIGIGQLSMGLGGLLKVGGSFATTLGKAGAGKGGAGLLGGLAMLGPGAATPVGLAIAGVGALGYVIHKQIKESKDLEEVSFDVIDALTEEANTLEKNIEAFDKLQDKNKLSNKEMGRFVEINAELQKTADPDVIKKLKDEQEKLLEKSGLTNEEMDTFLRLNKDIAMQVPETSLEISKQGEVLIENTEAAKKVNAEQRELIRLEYEMQMATAKSNRAKLKQQELELENQIEMLYIDRPKHIEKIKEAEARVAELDEEYRQAKETANYEEIARIYEKLDGERKNLDKLKKQGEELKTLHEKKVEELETTREQLKELDKVKQKYIEFELAQVGINAKKGEELKQIDQEITKLQNAKKELDEKHRKQEINTKEYENGKRKIDEQITELETAKRRVEDITSEAQESNKELGKDIDKDVKVDDNGTAKKIHDEAEKPATKKVTLSAIWKNLKTSLTSSISRWSLPSFAEGTNYHLGGLALVGEEGFELARLGNRWSMLDFGIADLPRGTQVFTHDESKKIIRALNNLPAFATGASPNGEANRVVSQLNNQSQVSEPAPIIVQQMIVREEADIKKVARELYQMQERNRRVILG